MLELILEVFETEFEVILIFGTTDDCIELLVFGGPHKQVDVTDLTIELCICDLTVDFWIGDNWVTFNIATDEREGVPLVAKDIFVDNPLTLFRKTNTHRKVHDLIIFIAIINRKQK